LGRFGGRRCCAPLPLHDALPILRRLPAAIALLPGPLAPLLGLVPLLLTLWRQRLRLVPLLAGVLALLRILTRLRGLARGSIRSRDRESTRLDSSHVSTSYAVCCW